MSITELFFEGENKDKQLFAGVTVGVVTDINDPEKLGRVKVKLLDRDTSEFETDYIRVMTPMTGAQWGMFFFPEIGDEVLVAFGGGDLTRPYILGSLWNQNNKPPVEIQDSKNDIRKIKTKSGHELIFKDEESHETIEIKTPKLLTISMDDEKEVIQVKDKEGKNILKIDSANGIVTILAEKKISIKTGNSSIDMDGDSNRIVIESNQSLQLKSQQISIEAKSGLDIKASSNMNIKSDGPLSLKGAVIKAN